MLPVNLHWSIELSFLEQTLITISNTLSQWLAKIRDLCASIRPTLLVGWSQTQSQNPSQHSWEPLMINQTERHVKPELLSLAEPGVPRVCIQMFIIHSVAVTVSAKINLQTVCNVSPHVTHRPPYIKNLHPRVNCWSWIIQWNSLYCSLYFYICEIFIFIRYVDLRDSECLG